VEIPKIGQPKSGAPFSPAAPLELAPAAPAGGNGEIVDMSLG
jgi:hypothetical protein